MTAKLEINEMFRDLRVAETVGQKLEMGWLEIEFTVYGTTYLKDGEMNYKISSEAGKIYQFMENALTEDVYCSNIQEFTHMCHVKNVVIGNATYVVSRVFVGNRNVSELIQKRVEASSSQLLPLTNSVPASYNDSGINAGLRRNHAN